MPAHISFYDKIKALGYSTKYNAVGIKSSIRNSLAKFIGKPKTFEPSVMEEMYNRRGLLSPSRAIASMTMTARKARETPVKTYDAYRDYLDGFDPSAAGGSGVTAVPAEEWTLYLAPDTAFDKTMQAIFKENDGREVGQETKDIGRYMNLDLNINPAKIKFTNVKIGKTTTTKYASQAEVVFISSATGKKDIKRIELHAAGQDIIAWSRSK